jgi:hypothetical protein
MRLPVFALLIGALLFPAIVAADGTVQPKYPPGFDCSAVAAGSQRLACNRSQLKPPMGAIPDTKRNQPSGITLPQPQAPALPTGRPPTVPRLPGTIDKGN